MALPSAMECTGSAPQSDLRREMKSACVPKPGESVAAAVSPGDGYELVFIGKNSKP